MTSSRNPSNTQADFVDLQISVGVLQSQQVENKKILDRIETKIDSMAYVKVSEFDDFKKELREIYVTKDEVKPIKTLFWSIISALIIGLIGLGFAALQGKLH